MITKARDGVLALIGFLLALVSAAFAVTAVASTGYWLWCVAFGGGLIKPTAVIVISFVLAIGTRFLATLDQYEYVPPPTKTTTTRRSSTGTPRNRKTTTTTKTTGGTRP